MDSEKGRPVALKNVGLVPAEGGIAVRDAVEAFLKFTDKPVIASRSAVISGLEAACRDGLIGIGRGLSLANLQSRHCREQGLSLDPKEDGVWIIPAFEPTRDEEQFRERETATDGGEKINVPDRTSTEGGDVEEPPRAIQRVMIRGIVPPESWSDIFRCFVSPAVRMQLGALKLGIEFELEASPSAPLNPDDPGLKAMREAARQLGARGESR